MVLCAYSDTRPSTPNVMLQGATTVIQGKTVKTFQVLKSVSGSPGQTHAFADVMSKSHVTAKVKFQDGSSSIVDIELP